MEFSPTIPFIYAIQLVWVKVQFISKLTRWYRGSITMQMHNGTPIKTPSPVGVHQSPLRYCLLQSHQIQKRAPNDYFPLFWRSSFFFFKYFLINLLFSLRNLFSLWSRLYHGLTDLILSSFMRCNQQQKQHYTKSPINLTLVHNFNTDCSSSFIVGLKYHW